MEKRIKAIIFDVGGVLQLSKSYSPSIRNNYTKGVHEYVAKKLGISVDQYFDSIDNIYPKTFEGKIPFKEALDILASNLKTSPKKLRQLYKKAYKKNFHINKPLLKFAKKLRKRGYKTAILSDMWYLSKETLVPKKLTKNFDVSVVSCDVGMRKPDIKIYKLALKKLNLNPEETVFIDNQQWNIDPAKRLGIKTILFENNRQLFEELKKLRVNVP